MANMLDISKHAGVSVTSVSHYINQTRHVSDEYAKRIEEAIAVLGYNQKKLGYKRKAVGILVDDNAEDFIDWFKITLEKKCTAQNFHLVTILSSDLEHQKDLKRICQRFNIEAVVVLSVEINSVFFRNIQKIKIPCVFVDSDISHIKYGGINFDYEQTIGKTVEYLKNLGHEKIVGIISKSNKVLYTKICSSYQYIHEACNKASNDFSFILVDDKNNMMEICTELLTDTNRPTALLTIGDDITIAILKCMNSQGYSCPYDISVVGVDIGDWAEVCHPPITSIAPDRGRAVNTVVARLQRLCDEKQGVCFFENESIILDAHIVVRGSTRNIGRGPFNEIAENPDTLELSQSDISMLKRKNYTAVISFHYVGDDWTRLCEKGIRDTCDNLGIKILAITDAHFDPQLQSVQIKNLLSMNPDVVMSIPVDTVKTTKAYRLVVEKNIKLVLISNVPKGLRVDDYVSCVALNERENGIIVANLMGNYMINHHITHAAFIIHGTNFLGTEQRDAFVIQTIRERFSVIDICSIQEFLLPEKAYTICRSIIEAHSEIEAIYVTWDIPCHFVKKALVDMQREDIAVFTTDLDYDIALDIATDGIVKGVSSQKPYEHGQAIALASANGLLGKDIPSFIEVLPYKVTAENLLSMWWGIYNETPPRELVSSIRMRSII